MTKETTVKLFEEKQVRTLWDAEQQNWYISVVDVIEILTGTDRPRKYWSDLKAKLKKEGSQLSEKIGQLKMKSSANIGKKVVSQLNAKDVFNGIKQARKSLSKKSKKR